jgi:hypothetical protein
MRLDGLGGCFDEARAGGHGDDRLLGCFAALACALEARQSVESAEEIASDGGVVAKIHLPPVGWIGHEADRDGVVRVQVLGTILDDLSGACSLSGSGDVEDSGFDAA